MDAVGTDGGGRPAVGGWVSTGGSGEASWVFLGRQLPPRVLGGPPHAAVGFPKGTKEGTPRREPGTCNWEMNTAC